MSFLKKLGGIILRGAVTIAGGQPVDPGALVPVLNGALGTLVQLAGIIISTEVAGQAAGLAGADKLKMAAPQVASVILHSNVLAGRKIANQELFMRGSTKIADGMADVLNSLQDDIPVENKLA